MSDRDIWAQSLYLRSDEIFVPCLKGARLAEALCDKGSHYTPCHSVHPEDHVRMLKLHPNRKERGITTWVAGRRVLASSQYLCGPSL